MLFEVDVSRCINFSNTHELGFGPLRSQLLFHRVACDLRSDGDDDEGPWTIGFAPSGMVGG
jgi:hypothetical protein